MATTIENEYDDHPVVQIDLVSDSEGSGQPNTPLGKYILGEVVSGFSVNVRELYAVHGTGTWDSGPDEPASLLIYRINPVDHEPTRGRRFKNITIEMSFKSAYKNALPEDDPYVACFAPAQKYQIGLLPKNVVRDKYHTRKASLDFSVGPYPTLLGMGLGNEKLRECKKDVWANMSGSAGENVVRWEISPRSEDNGVIETLDTVDVAILLRRPNNLPFNVDFSKVKATVDWKYAVAEKTHKAIDAITDLGSGKSTKQYRYNPLEKGKCPTGVTDKNMDTLEQEGNLEKVAFMHAL